MKATEISSKFKHFHFKGQYLSKTYAFILLPEVYFIYLFTKYIWPIIPVVQWYNSWYTTH